MDPKLELETLVNWITEYVNDSWSLDIESTMIADCWRFSFTNAEDAVLFKMTWDAKTSLYEVVNEAYVDANGILK